MKLIHSLTSRKSDLVYVYIFQGPYLFLKDTCKIRRSKKYRKLWTMHCGKSVQSCVVVLLIDTNGIHKNNARKYYSH